MTDRRSALTYRAAGVDHDQQDRSMERLTRWITATFAFRPEREVVLPLGYFANVLALGNDLGLAVSTDGVGTKAMIAQLLGRYDTIGIDCVAMNVNDVLCVGAEPLALLDYLALEAIEPSMLEALARGLHDGARSAGISIPGGEIAQIREMIQGPVPGRAFDLVGTCVGVVPVKKILDGSRIVPGQAVLGLRSSGIHSNGLTLARRVLLAEGWGVETHVTELGRTLGEELLEPTRIYVKPVLALLEAGVAITGLAHITSTGFLNLTRHAAPVGYELHTLPEPQPIFRLIQERGDVPEAEMFFTYNMGVGFCIVLDAAHAGRALAILEEQGVEAQVMGETVADPEKKVRLPAHRLSGHDRFATY
jgi:phosphoribosylformylglycinamidine cyclo-ligase